ncbi:hypothetical protein [Rhodoblastus sp.]|uniref:hypothetical protein n=1 Tax=Rhodoblastus sp. TaxID=1962975 RepID=UPI0025F7B37E|nr:hypothetical protein [Rhodoblastus sp.]
MTTSIRLCQPPGKTMKQRVEAMLGRRRAMTQNDTSLSGDSASLIDFAGVRKLLHRVEQQTDDGVLSGARRRRRRGCRS